MMRSLRRRLVAALDGLIAHAVWVADHQAAHQETSWRQTASMNYAALAGLAQRYGWDSLGSFEAKVFSQNGEDGVLAEIFSHIGTTNSFFVEFGSSDGIECNTRLLMEVLGWSGAYFEPDARAFAALSDRLAARLDVSVLQAAVTAENVNDLFAKVEVPEEPDLVSIDIDGQDYWVWEALEGYRPRVVVIEYNASLSGRLVERKDPTAVWEPQKGFGSASLDAMKALATKKGYTFVYAELAGVNLFFVRDDLSGAFDTEAVARGANFELLGRRHPPFQGQFVEV